MLLPWARCEAFRHQWNGDVAMLAPAWGHHLHGSFTASGYVRGVRRMRVLLTARRTSEDEFIPGAHDASHARDTLVVFTGPAGGLQQLVPHRELIRRRLMEILSARVRRLLVDPQSPPQPQPPHTDFVIGVHVRRANRLPLDFREPRAGPRHALPDSWFVRCIQNLRKVLGFAAPVRLFSDAPAPELRVLLAMPNVSLAPRRERLPIADLLALSRSKILIASAHSMFSQWAALFGEMPSLWYPGCAPLLNADRLDYEVETDVEGHFTRDFAGVVESLSLTLNP
jgi:hypothetical protein